MSTDRALLGRTLFFCYNLGMYRINEQEYAEKYILLIPAMLDAHFPLLKYAFYSGNYHPVILENEEGVTEVGLSYVNNDMCYPAILNIGQMISALQSGAYDLSRTKVLMPTAGDACRGSNYTGALRRALQAAGFPQVQVLSLNVQGLEKENQMKLTPGMVWRALFGLFYGDILMLLTNQVLPYELRPGDTEACRQHWIRLLSEDLKRGKKLSLRHMKETFYRIAEDFAKISKTGEKKQRIGIVGELYIKYCHMGNWNLEQTLRQENCESHTNGLSWYVLYYMDTHLVQADTMTAGIYRIGMQLIEGLQKDMIAAMKKYGFYTLPEFSVLKQEAESYVGFHDTIGDGWLIGAEMVSHILHDCRKVVAIQPFACMPNQICGRGLYPSIARKLPQARIVSVDVDSSASKLNAYNRIKMLIDNPL